VRHTSTTGVDAGGGGGGGSAVDLLLLGLLGGLPLWRTRDGKRRVTR
jgi:hypothetical protein